MTQLFTPVDCGDHRGQRAGDHVGQRQRRRIAAPMVNGVISSMVLTLGAIPAPYGPVKPWRLECESRVTPAPIAVPEARAPTA
jgi:hypothetical protein